MRAQSKVVLTVFEDFITKLRSDDKFDQAAADRISAALIEKGETDQAALAQALFAEDVIE